MVTSTMMLSTARHSYVGWFLLSESNRPTEEEAKKTLPSDIRGPLPEVVEKNRGPLS